MPETAPSVDDPLVALRESNEVAPLTQAQSYYDEWSITQVASHLGSGVGVTLRHAFPGR